MDLVKATKGKPNCLNHCFIVRRYLQPAILLLDDIYSPQMKFGARLCFYTCLSVILFTRGLSAPLYAGIHTPLCRHPSRQTPPWSDTFQADTLRQTLPYEQTPPRQTPPPAPTTGYGQQAGSTHLTGMHTCCHLSRKCLFERNNSLQWYELVRSCSPLPSLLA